MFFRRSKLDVRTERNNTVLLEIEPKKFECISIDLKQKLKEFLINEPDFDHINIEEMEQTTKNWNFLKKTKIKNQILKI